jgi:hypothetical protein
MIVFIVCEQRKAEEQRCGGNQGFCCQCHGFTPGSFWEWEVLSLLSLGTMRSVKFPDKTLACTPGTDKMRSLFDQVAPRNAASIL